MEGGDNWGYSSDDKNVFFGATVLQGANPKSTFLIEYEYACNNDFVYYNGKIMAGAKPHSFVTLYCGGYTKDAASYYFYGEKSDEKETGCQSEDVVVHKCNANIY